MATGCADAALYFPRLVVRHPSEPGSTFTCVPCGAVAGALARIYQRRGVWKAPAGGDAVLQGAAALSRLLSDEENTRLSAAGGNALRAFPGRGHVIWGARTLAGADDLGSEWKYLNVRRLALFIEASVDEGTRWAVFEPNDEPLWPRLREAADAFLLGLFRAGALQGTRPEDAWFVRCDRTTMTQADIDAGRINVVIGFAALKPAKFVVIGITQCRRDDADCG